MSSRSRTWILPSLLLLILCLGKPVHGENSREAVNYYALASLEDKAVAARLAARFKALGEPVFLIHNPDIGVAQGDIMRFRDRAVLIDADVWQTLRTEGAFAGITSASLVKVQARATVEAWKTRGDLVKSEPEKKAYHLGARLIQALEENFESLPENRQMVVVFEDNHLKLLAPASLLAQLRMRDIRRVPPQGSPRIVSRPPDPAFSGHDFFWQAWAVDPASPSQALTYSIQGELPEGIIWDKNSHALKGTPKKTGTWPLVLSVRNEIGRRDTLGFTLMARDNSPPRLAQSPEFRAVVGRPWRYEVDIVDADHPGYSVGVKPLEMPEGMQFDSTKRIFTWEVPRGSPDSLQVLALSLIDPLGDSTLYKFNLSVHPSDKWILTEGLYLQLPWDTLRQGHVYHWDADASMRNWAERGLHLEAVVGEDSTDFTEGILTVKPGSTPAHRLTFFFIEDDKLVERSISLDVAPNRPPVFTSEVGIAHVREKEFVNYRPVANDPDGDSLIIEAWLPQDGPFNWDGERLYLYANGPGLYAAELSAHDPSGNIGRQRVVYRVLPGNPRYLTTEHHWQAGMSLLKAYVALGQGRVGIFVPDMRRQIGWREWSEQEWPFVYFGSNLYPPLPSGSSRPPRALWVDLGLTLRVPDFKLVTGGIYTRVQGHWQFPEGLVHRVELDVQGFVHQAIVLADTTGLNMDWETLFTGDNRLHPHIQRITRDATAKENMVFFSRLEAWRSLDYGFWAGMGLWREDFPMRGTFNQRIGAGLRFEARWAGFGVRNSLRGGWGPDGAGWGLQWNSEIDFGRN